MITKYNIIGDIHGRSNWENLIDPSRINIFVGDYFDPYDNYQFEQLERTFLDIIQFAKTHPNTILLLGNHDLHYIYGRESTRYDYTHANDIKELFLSNMHMFHGIAYNIGEECIVSHAGVTKDWLDKIGYCDSYTPSTICNYVNNLFWDGYTETSDGQRGWDELYNRGMRHFMFESNAKFSDYCGTSSTHSPIWVRINTLIYSSAIPDKLQVVGHTQMHKISIDNPALRCTKFSDDDEVMCKGRIVDVDVLGQTTESLYIDYDEQTKKIELKVNQKQF